MLSKSLIQFSFDGWGYIPSLLFTWGQTMVEIMKIMVASFKRSHARTARLTAPQPCTRPPLTQAFTGDSWTLPGKSRPVFCGVTAPFYWVLVHTKFCLCPPRVYFLLLCKFWQLYGGVNGDLLQEGLCHTQVCYTQSSCPCDSPLLTCTSTGDDQTQLCRVSEKAEESEIKLPIPTGSSKKPESSRKYIYIFPLYWLCQRLWLCGSQQTGKFFKRWEYQIIWFVSWEICMQVRKQQLELDMEQQTGSK